jgi:hypothetical protein
MRLSLHPATKRRLGSAAALRVRTVPDRRFLGMGQVRLRNVHSLPSSVESKVDREHEGDDDEK